MFQFRRFPTYAYLIQRRLTEYCSAGFPHSVIHGSTLMCSSPWLIAACHDLLRLLMPRHSPCALSSLTSLEPSQAPHGSQLLRIMQAFNGRFLWLIVLPIQVPQFALDPLLLASHFWNVSSLFSFQGAAPTFKARFQCSVP